MKKLILGDSTLDYAITGGGAASSATSPDLLDPGSVGCYGISPATNKLVLINAANDDLAYTEYVVAVGTNAGGPVVSQPINIAGVPAGFPKGAATSASASHVVAVGYNGTSGSFNLPTLVDRDWGEVKLVKTTNGINQEVDKDVFEASNLDAADTEYDVAVDLVNAGAAKDANTVFVNTRVKILDDLGAGTNLSNTLSILNGATTGTSTAHAMTAGDYLRIDGDLYLTVTGTVTNTIVLDRPYTGPSNTAIAAASCQDLGSTAPTAVGVEFTAEAADVVFDAAVQGVLANATISVVTQGVVGSGTPIFMAELVRTNKAYFGYYDQIDRRRPAPETGWVGTLNYDLYLLHTAPTYPARNEMNGTFTTKYEVTVGFDTVGGGTSQTVFQTVINTIHGTSISI